MDMIELPEEVDRKLSAAALQAGTTKTAIVVEAVMSLLEDLEDVALADQVLTDLRAGRTSTKTLEEVERELDLDR